MRVAYKLPDRIDIERFRHAWAIAVGQIPILRTRVVNVASQGLVQVVVSSPSPVELHSHPETMEFEETMGLGTALCRAGLFVNAKSSRFVLHLHHAIYDGWSKELILSTIEKAYSEGYMLLDLALGPFR